MQNPFLKPVEKFHYDFAPSSMARILRCHGSFGESESERDKSLNDAADEGQIGHDIFEACMKDGGSAERYIGRAMIPSDGSPFVLEIDRHFARAVDAALRYARQLVGEWPGFGNASVSTEQQVVLKGYETVCGGTLDLSSIRVAPLSQGDWGFRVDIADLKMGMLEVDAEANAQLMSYAVMLLDGFDLWDRVETVGLHILQPRQFFGERFKHVDVPVSALAEFRLTLTATIGAIVGGSRAFAAGTWCRYCGRLGMCPASGRAIRDLMVQIETDPALLSSAALGWAFEMRKVLKSYIDRAESILKDRAMRGEDIGRPLVMSRKHRQWRDPDKTRAVIAQTFGVEGLDPPTPAQLKGRFPKRKDEVDAIVSEGAFTPEGTPTVGDIGDKRPVYSRPSLADIWKPKT